MRKKVSIFFLCEPDFHKYACEFLILKLNDLQTTFEFEVIGVKCKKLEPFGTEAHYERSYLMDEFSKIINQDYATEIKKDQYYIGIAKMGIDPKYDLFYATRKNMAIVTTKRWEKSFSPPSVFEFILSSLAGTLIEMSMRMQASHEIDFHEQTRGCLIDYTDDKQENRIDVLLGYICDDCKASIEQTLGKDAISSFRTISSHDWLGETDDKEKAAYYVKKFFKVDLNKDTGFNKTKTERLRDGIPSLARDILIGTLPAVIVFLVTLWLTQGH